MMLLLELIDGLRERGVLARLESCEIAPDGRVSLRLWPAAHEGSPAARLEPAERDDEDEAGLKYASS